MKRLVVAALALTLAAGPAFATGYYPPPYVPPAPKVVHGGGSQSVPFFVPCIIGGAAGIILAAIVVGRTQNRELTQSEAMLTGFTCGIGGLWVMNSSRPVAARARVVRVKN